MFKREVRFRHIAFLLIIVAGGIPMENPAEAQPTARPLGYEASTDSRHLMPPLMDGIGNGDYQIRPPIMRGDHFASWSVIDQSIQTPLSSGVGLWHSVGSVSPGDKPQPGFGVVARILEEARFGADLTLGGEYQPMGFNGVPAVTAIIGARRMLGRSTIVLDLRYGLGLAQSERFSTARLGTFYRVRERLHIGIGSRAGADLERDEIEPPGERAWEIVTGPQVMLTGDTFFLNAGLGMSVTSLRLQPHVYTALLSEVAFGALF